MEWFRRWASAAIALTAFVSAAVLVQLVFDHSARRAQALDTAPPSSIGLRPSLVSAVGTPFLVASGKADQVSPTVAYDSQLNRYLVVWQDTGDDMGNIYGQLIDGGGNLWSMPFPISTAPGLQSHPTLSYNPQPGEYLVVWQDRRDGDTTAWDVYAQRVSGDGELLDSAGAPEANTAQNNPITQAEGAQFGPAVAFDPALARYLVIWENDLVMEDDEGNVIAYDRNLYGRLLSAVAQPVGEPFVISSGSGDHSFPALVYNASRGQYLVVWQRQDVWLTAQHVDGGGQLVGPRLTISTGSFRVYPVPRPKAVHNDDRDEYLVVWDTATTGDIYGRRLDGDGRPLEIQPFAISTAPQEQLRPSLGRHRTLDGYLTIWTDTRSRAAQGYDVYGQFLSSEGAPLNEAGTPAAGVSANVPLSLAAGDQISPTLAYNGRQNEYLLVWQDGRDALSLGWDIYAQRYVAGAIGPTPTATHTPSPTPTHTPTPTVTPSPTATPTPLRVYVPAFPANAPARWTIHLPIVTIGPIVAIGQTTLARD